MGFDHDADGATTISPFSGIVMQSDIVLETG